MNTCLSMFARERILSSLVSHSAVTLFLHGGTIIIRHLSRYVYGCHRPIYNIRASCCMALSSPRGNITVHVQMGYANEMEFETQKNGNPRFEPRVHALYVL